MSTVTRRRITRQRAPTHVPLARHEEKLAQREDVAMFRATHARQLCTAVRAVESTRLYRFKWVKELRVALRLKVPAANH